MKGQIKSASEIIKLLFNDGQTTLKNYGITGNKVYLNKKTDTELLNIPFTTEYHGYNVTVTISIEDDEPLFVAAIKELPDCNEYSEYFTEVLELAFDTIDTYKEIKLLDQLKG